MPLTKPNWIEDEIEDDMANDIRVHIKNPHVAFARNAEAWKQMLASDEKNASQVRQMMVDNVTSHRKNLSNLQRFMGRSDARKTRVLAKYVARGGNELEITNFIADYKNVIDALEAAPKDTRRQIEQESDRLIADVPKVNRERLFD